MSKLSVAFVLVALALNASAKPQNIAAPGTRHNRAINTAPKTNYIFDNDDAPAIERQNSTVDTTKDEVDDFDKLWPPGVNYIDSMLDLKEFVLNAFEFDSEHRPKIKAFFDKYPEPDYFNARKVANTWKTLPKISKSTHNPKDCPFGPDN